MCAVRCGGSPGLLRHLCMRRMHAAPGSTAGIRCTRRHAGVLAAVRMIFGGDKARGWGKRAVGVCMGVERTSTLLVVDDNIGRLPHTGAAPAAPDQHAQQNEPNCSARCSSRDGDPALSIFTVIVD